MIPSSPAQYLQSLPTESRRQNGQVYTPEYLVTFVLEVAGYAGNGGNATATVLDPACGGGAFLERAVFLLAARLRAECGTAASFRSRLLEVVTHCLFGVDVDPNACALARFVVRRAVQAAAPGALPTSFFQENVLCEDFLTSHQVDALEPVTNGGFSFIVGNPPYVGATRIAAAYKAEMRRRFAASGGRLDLYTVFIERSLDLLAARGRLAFITPDKFLVSQTGRAIRRHILAKSAVRTVALFRSHKVFDDAATVPCVTVLERGGLAGAIEVLRCVDDRSEASPRIDIRERTTGYEARLTSEPWHLLPHQDLAFARRLQASHPRLPQLAVRVSTGPATGRDGIFVFPAGSQPEIEAELRRPVVRGRDIEAFGVKDPRLEILVPYVFDRTGAPSLINLSEFPGAAAYLRHHRRLLEDRHCVRVWEKRWYDFHDQLMCDLARRTKIVVPDVANTNRFAVDEGTFLPLHSVYYILPKSGVDPYYVTGVLNSSVAAFLIRLFAPVVKDGFSRYRQQFLAELPVPDANQRTHTALARAARAGDAACVDSLVASLFGLSEQDRERIVSALAAMARP